MSMRHRRIAAIVLFTTIGSLILLAAFAAWASTLDHAQVKQLLNARSADGDVESYSEAFHADVVGKCRALAVVLAIVAILALIVQVRVRQALVALVDGSVRFACDARAHLRSTYRSMGKAERAGVVFLLALAAVLRMWKLDLPVIYDEAFTCTYYAVRPWYIIVSDYSYPNNHILHTLLVKCSLAMFGWGEVQMRLPAFFAGMLAFFLCWLWLRSGSGKAAAFGSLALMAVCAPLVEYGALARGYGIAWMCLVLSFLLARYAVHSRNVFAFALLSIVNACGMWAVPTMLYGSAAVWSWIAIQGDGPVSLRRWFASGIAFVLLTMALYAPVLVVYGPEQLFYDETMGPRSWPHFLGSVIGIAGRLGASPWPVLLLVCAGAAATISGRYLNVLLALLMGAVPIVLFQHMIGPPRIWLFGLFLLLPAPVIVIEAIVDRWVGTRQRAITALLALVLACVVATFQRPSDLNRFTGARDAAAWFTAQLSPTDRVLVNVPCEAPLEFYFRMYGIGNEPLYRTPHHGSRLWFVIGEGYDHTFEALSHRARLVPYAWTDPRPVRDLDGIAIFAAHYQ